MSSPVGDAIFGFVFVMFVVVVAIGLVSLTQPSNYALDQKRKEAEEPEITTCPTHLMPLEDRAYHFPDSVSFVKRCLVSNCSYIVFATEGEREKYVDAAARHGRGRMALRESAVARSRR